MGLVLGTACASAGGDGEMPADIASEAKLPPNRPTAAAGEIGPLYEDLRVARVWKQGNAGEGTRVVALDAEHNFVLPPAPTSANIDRKRVVHQVSRTFWTTNSVVDMAPAVRALASDERPHGTFVAQLAAGSIGAT